MSLSKPIYSLLFAYFEQLYKHPLRTKAVTCSIIAGAGNLAAQYIAGNKVINYDSLAAYVIYGLVFGGPIPHYFHNWLERAVPEEKSLGPLRKLLIERLVFTPLFQMLVLYVIPRLERKDHEVALKQLQALYWPVLLLNWKFLTVFNFLNLTVIPPVLRVIFGALIGFFWTIYIATKRRRFQKTEKSE